MDVQQTQNDLLDAAAKKTGLDDFGDDTFREGLDTLLYSIKHEADLNFRGKVFMHDFLLLPLLMNRLYICDWVKGHPEILDEEIKKPLFVIAFPRSGTTLLHNLLSLDPVNRFLVGWEAQEPCPPPEIFHDPFDPRIQRSLAVRQWMLRLSPELKKSVSLNLQTSGPEECHRLLQHEFKSKGFGVYFHVPGYMKWLSQCNLQTAYEYHNLFLKLLQWRNPKERWILKSPIHMFGLRALLNQYPDANIIFIHRDPLISLASSLNLNKTVLSIFSDSVNPHALAEEKLAMHIRTADNLLKIRSTASDANIYDLYYVDLIKDPVNAVKCCYKHFGIKTGNAHEKRMNIWLRDHPQHKYGKHRYSLQSFGIDPKTARQCFNRYQSEMNISSENGSTAV
jgi:hypothetical protein